MLLRYALCFGLALSLAAGLRTPILCGAEPNALSPDEKSAGFELLFNGDVPLIQGSTLEGLLAAKGPLTALVTELEEPYG